ncbi:MAG: HAD hydrolase-like protein [Candidatus Omnitrophica bacterium]|nr:HAD hydrolase-like protein [Candidatus Omnitrophota bacterium]
MDYFFIDIDGTITDNNPYKKYPEEKLVWGNPIFGVIRDVMVEEGWDSEEARKAIEEYADKIVWWDYPDILAEFNLPLAKTLEKIYQWHYEYKVVYWDTVELIRELYRRRKNLFIVSNNPIVGCLLNLKVARLGDITGSKYFKRILGANILRGQKYQVELWRRAIFQIGVEPDKIANIGDNVKEDGEIPLRIGIKKCFIIKRDITYEENRNGIVLIKNPLEILKFIS